MVKIFPEFLVATTECEVFPYFVMKILLDLHRDMLQKKDSQLASKDAELKQISELLLTFQNRAI